MFWKKTCICGSIMLIFFITAARPLSAACPERLTVEAWLTVWAGGEQKQRAFLDQLKECVPRNEKLQDEVDRLAVDSLYSLESIPEEDQRSLVNFASQALYINAQAGCPSSQHNYAALHNAEPGSVLRKIAPQNHSTFLYWTRKAAAQREPRAVFNLAARMCGDKAVKGVVRDLPTAYILLTFLERTYGKSKELPTGMMEYVKKMRSRIKKKLGAKQAGKLDAAVNSFDFSKLAPNPATQ